MDAFQNGVDDGESFENELFLSVTDHHKDFNKMTRLTSMMTMMT